MAGRNGTAPSLVRMRPRDNDERVSPVPGRNPHQWAGVAAAAIFILCWLGTFAPLSSPTHAYIGLFTEASIGSSRALAAGACWSFLFGGLSGGLIALLYNLFASLEPR